MLMYIGPIKNKQKEHIQHMHLVPQPEYIQDLPEQSQAELAFLDELAHENREAST